MLEKDEGIVLGTARSGDTSLTVRFLGRQAGKVRFIVKGAMRPKHQAHGTLQPGNYVEVLYYRKENRSVYYIKEVTLLFSSASRDSLDHLASVLAAMELLDAVCYDGVPDEAVVDAGLEYVRGAGVGDALVMFLAFELKLLLALGAAPQLSVCATCGEPLTGGTFVPQDGESYCRRHKTGRDALVLSQAVIEFARSCGDAPLADVAALPVDLSARKQLGKIVHWTYTYHVQGYSLPKSLRLI